MANLTITDLLQSITATKISTANNTAVPTIIPYINGGQFNVNQNVTTVNPNWYGTVKGTVGAYGPTGPAAGVITYNGTGGGSGAADIWVNHMNKMQQDIFGEMAIPQYLLEPEPEVLVRYPITNSAFTHLHNMESVKKALVSGITASLTHLTEEMKHLDKVLFDGTEIVLGAELKQARFHKDIPGWTLRQDRPSWLEDGNTYDPWFRNISQHKAARYIPLHSPMLSVGVRPNQTNYIAVWTYGCTVGGIKVKLLLHEFIEVIYTNKQRRTKYLDSISPYSVKVDSKYDLANYAFSTAIY